MIMMIIGVPGAGKTTFLAHLTKKYRKKKKAVYSNVYIEGAEILNHEEDLNQYTIENGLVIIDEGGTVLDNRSWKNHSKRIIRWYKMHRHYQCDVAITSQDFDIDVKIRSLVERIYIVRKSLIPYCISVRKVITKNGISEDNTQIQQQYEFMPILLGGLKIIFAPPLWKMFDSYYKDKLAAKEWYKWCKEHIDKYTYDFTNPETVKQFESR